MKIPNIIKLAGLAAKDSPGALRKKLSKVSSDFVTQHDLELDSYLSRSELPFSDKCTLIEDCFLCYELMRVFVCSFTTDLTLRHLMYEEIKLSVPELRKCGYRPYHKLWEHMAEVLSRNAEYINSYEPELNIPEEGYAQMPDLELDNGDQFTGQLINKNKGIEGLYLDLADHRVPGDDSVIYAAELSAAYCIWLQAVVGWTKPLVILKDTFPEGHFTGKVTSNSRSRAKTERKSKPKKGKCNG